MIDIRSIFREECHLKQQFFGKAIEQFCRFTENEQTVKFKQNKETSHFW